MFSEKGGSLEGFGSPTVKQTVQGERISIVREYKNLPAGDKYISIECFNTFFMVE